MLPSPLTTWVQEQLGTAVAAQRPVGGGCIHRAWALELADGRRLFAKTNDARHLPLLDAEADGLTALATAAAGDPVVPRPLHWGERGGQALLLLEWLPLARSPGGSWWALGASLARLHRRSLEQSDGRFGWHRDNVIGDGPQPNGWRLRWGAFFAEQRLGTQLAWAARSGRRLEGAEALLEQVPQWLEGHGAQPCLVHGDLWSGNAALLEDGRGALFDPAVYRGDREVDLAMARLFGGFPEAFFTGYAATWPLPEGHQRRVELYNLYHLLNHSNLFGGSYWSQSQQSLQRLLRHPPLG
ncbi:fructosamine kinase family protein [Vulcanococcus limneticus]|uniref:fructosamine kinase family protein n=1 Tax=Vulcanococcus limneticus TaxID=2170428 RepID=UPI00398BE00D